MDRRAALFASFLLVAGGCSTQFDPCFEQPEVIHPFDLRVLAVRTDPPQALADLAAGSVQPVQLRALVVDGQVDLAASLQIGASACVPDANGGCLYASVVREVQPTDISAIAFPFVSPADLIARALDADPLRGFGGVPVQIALDAVDSRGATSRAYKTLLYSPPDATDAPNHGLEIAGLRLRRLSYAHNNDPKSPPYPAEEFLQPGDAIRLDLFDAVWLRPLLAPGPGGTEAAELYETTDLAGNRVQLRETITYSFYTSFGAIAAGGGGEGVVDPRPRAFFLHTDDTEPPPGQDPPGIAEFVARSVSTGTIWVVARDSRGAEAWASFVWQSRTAALDIGVQPNYSTCAPGLNQ